MSAVCPICKSSFFNKKQLRKHHKKCHECPRCNKEFKTLRSKKKHMKDAHKKSQAEREPSFGELARQAELDHAMGEYNPDYEWLCDP